MDDQIQKLGTGVGTGAETGTGTGTGAELVEALRITCAERGIGVVFVGRRRTMFLRSACTWVRARYGED